MLLCADFLESKKGKPSHEVENYVTYRLTEEAIRGDCIAADELAVILRKKVKARLEALMPTDEYNDLTVLQETVMMKIFANINNLRNSQAIFKYMHKVTVNEFRNYQRCKIRRRERNKELESKELLEHSIDASIKYCLEELVYVVLADPKTPDKEREFLELAYIQKRTTKEICHDMRITPNHSYKLMYSVKELLIEEWNRSC